MELLVRYSEIHRKKGKTRNRLIQTLRHRIQDRLEYENFTYGKVSTRPGRTIISNFSQKKRKQSLKYYILGYVLRLKIPI
jgi:adenylyl- and sulfurtransferase ThiI